MICTQCNMQGRGETVRPGSFIIEVILWLFFIVPGIIYSIWRICAKYKVCKTCGGRTLIPKDSPAGMKLMEDLKC